MQATKPSINNALTQEAKAFGVPFISIVVVILIFLFAVVPLWNRVGEKNRQLTEDKKKLSALAAKEDQLRKLDTDEVDRKFLEAELALPSAKEVPALLVGISRLYQEQGLQLSAFKITPGNVATSSAALNSPNSSATIVGGGSAGLANQIFPSSRRLDFDIVLNGTIEQGRGFLSTLEKSRRLTIVNTFTFTKSVNGNSQIILRISAPFDPFPPLPEDFTAELPTLTSVDEEYLKKLSSYTPLTTPFTTNSTGGSLQNPFTGTRATPTPTAVPTAVNPSPTPTATSSGVVNPLDLFSQ